MFRRFFEENYSICHNLEYFVPLPIIFITQAKCIVILYGGKLSDAIQAMMGVSNLDDYPPYLFLIGIIYLAIAIATIVTNLPSEKVKTKIKSPRISIVGAGDVVSKRLLPAIKKLFPKMQIDIFHKDVCKIDEEAYHYYNFKDKIIRYMKRSEIEKKIMTSDILWIATPSHKHIPILEEWIYKNNKFIVIEKPLTSDMQELNKVKNYMNSPMWNKVFSLSYYYQEKALPLTYIFNPNLFYEKYLTFKGMLGREWQDLRLDGEEWRNLLLGLGDLKKCSIEILEGEENREWTWMKDMVDNIWKHLYTLLY